MGAAATCHWDSCLQQSRRGKYALLHKPSWVRRQHQVRQLFLASCILSLLLVLLLLAMLLLLLLAAPSSRHRSATCMVLAAS
jgi:hypothetical protein